MGTEQPSNNQGSERQAGAETGRRVLTDEAAALSRLAQSLGPVFEEAVNWLVECSGRVLTCGVGKSGHIARKVAGTLSSTGTTGAFLHAAEAVHGDLGMVAKGDIVILYSHSGETDEIVRLFPSLESLGARTILITGRPKSSAGQMANLILDTGVDEEACSLNLAPTTSTTAMLALSDALAIAAMEARGFGSEDFARFHPSGTLGRRLTLTSAGAMRPIGDIAVCTTETPFLEVTRAITKAGVGAACIVDGERLIGFISDGDIRRAFLRDDPLSLTAKDIMTVSVTTIGPDLLAVEALEFFQNLPHQLGEMPVVENGRLLGLLMLKDLLRSGIV